jgi:hypothetical protein
MAMKRSFKEKVRAKVARRDLAVKFGVGPEAERL